MASESSGDQIDVSYLNTVFELYSGYGYFKGRSVATPIIKIGTVDSASVEALGNELGQLLNQKAIGLETAEMYRSISMV